MRIIKVYLFSGALFTYDQINSSLEQAFKFAVNQINLDANLLPYTQVHYDIRYVPHDNSFQAIKTGIKNKIFFIFLIKQNILFFFL